MYTDGINYEGGVRIVTLLASGFAGDLACTNINILDDGMATSMLYFSLNIYISDTHVLIPDDKANATVIIQPGKYTIIVATCIICIAVTFTWYILMCILHIDVSEHLRVLYLN